MVLEMAALSRLTGEPVFEVFIFEFCQSDLLLLTFNVTSKTNLLYSSLGEINYSKTPHIRYSRDQAVVGVYKKLDNHRSEKTPFTSSEK